MKGSKFDFYSQNLKQKLKLFLKKPSFILFYLDRMRKYSSLTDYPLIIVSYPKSGRTWLQKIIIEAARLEFKISENIIDISTLTQYAKIPKILSTHAGSSWEEFIKDESKIKEDDWKAYEHAKILFLYRDPRDVLVSQYYHIKHRTGYSNYSKDYLIENKNVGLKKIINFMNKWKSNSKNHPQHVIESSYEALKKDSFAEITKLFHFWEIEISDENIKKAIENCSLEKMKQKEAQNSDSPWSTTENKKDANAFHSRKGIIGEYKEFFSSEEITLIDNTIEQKLNKEFSY